MDEYDALPGEDPAAWQKRLKLEAALQRAAAAAKAKADAEKDGEDTGAKAGSGTAPKEGSGTAPKTKAGAGSAAGAGRMTVELPAKTRVRTKGPSKRTASESPPSGRIKKKVRRDRASIAPLVLTPLPH